MRHFEYFSNNVYNIKILSYFSDRRNPFRMLSNAMDFRNRRKMHRPKSADCDRPLGGGNNSSISENPAGGKIKSYIPKSRFVASFVVLHNWARISWLPNLNENHFAKQAQQTICHALNHMHPNNCTSSFYQFFEFSHSDTIPKQVMALNFRAKYA